MRRPLGCERGRQLRSHTTLARRHYKQTVETRFLCLRLYRSYQLCKTIGRTEPTAPQASPSRSHYCWQPSRQKRDRPQRFDTLPQGRFCLAYHRRVMQIEVVAPILNKAEAREALAFMGLRSGPLDRALLLPGAIPNGSTSSAILSATGFACSLMLRVIFQILPAPKSLSVPIT